MRIILIAILMASICFPSVSLADGEKVVYALFSRGWPPFEMVVDGKPEGAVMHIIRAIMPADVKPAVEPMPSPRGALYSPKGAVYVRLEASEWMKRRDECLWSDPVMSLKNKLYSPAGAPIDYAGLESLEGKVIGCIRNYTYPVVEGLFAEGKAQRYDVNSDLVLLRMLKAGRIDAIVMDSIVVDWVIKKTPDLVRSDFYVAEKAVDVVGLRLVFNKKPGWEKRLPEINERIAKLRSDGTLKEIMARYQ